jgi:hypothetical protein
LAQLYQLFNSSFGEHICEIIRELIHSSLINLFKSKNPSILSNQELFREVLQYFMLNGLILQSAIDFLISQISMNAKIALEEIHNILISIQGKEASIAYLQSSQFFDLLIQINESDLQSLILEIFSHSLPFYQIPIHDILTLFLKHINQPQSFHNLKPQ